MLPVAPPLDLVIHARPSAYRVAFDELETIIVRLTAQLPAVAERLSRPENGTAAHPPRPTDDASPV
jgi:hypothetical protein